MYKRIINDFLTSEDGSAAFDWKILSAFVVGGGLLVGTYIYEGSETGTETIEVTLEDESLPDRIFPGRTNY